MGTPGSMPNASGAHVPRIPMGCHPRREWKFATLLTPRGDRITRRGRCGPAGRGWGERGHPASLQLSPPRLSFGCQKLPIPLPTIATPITSSSTAITTAFSLTSHWCIDSRGPDIFSEATR